MRRIVIISTLSLLEMTNYAIRKQKLCLKRDKSLRMGFCRKDPAKKKENKLRFPPPPTPRLKLRRKPRQPRSQDSLLPAVTAFWVSPRFGHPHSQIPSVLGIPGGGCPKR